MGPNLSAAPVERRRGVLVPTAGISGPVAQKTPVHIRRVFRSFREGRVVTGIFGVVPQDSSSNFQPKLTPLREGDVTRIACSPQFIPPRARVSVVPTQIFSHSTCYRSRGPPRQTMLAL
jgi:hypothetical protein